MKLLLGCRDTKPYLSLVGKYDSGKNYYEAINDETIFDNKLNGKIVVECDFEAEEITDDRLARAISDEMFCIERDNLLKGSCLTGEEIKKYFNFYNWKFEKQDIVIGYAIHIKNLNIFERPDEKYFYYFKTKYGDMYHLNQTPKNMIYVYDIDEIKKILLYLYPEELCNILNGKQTTLVRKTVLKEMLEPTGAERQ